MTRRIVIMVIAATVTLWAAQALAHDEYRIIGTIVVRQDSKLEVKSKEGKMFSVKMDGETLVYRDNKKVDVAELRAGRHVVVDARGDNLADLLAVEVRIIASLPK